MAEERARLVPVADEVGAEEAALGEWAARRGASLAFIQSSKVGRLLTKPRRADQAPWHFLYFLPDPHGQGSLRPTFGWLRVTVLVLPASSPAAAAP